MSRKRELHRHEAWAIFKGLAQEISDREMLNCLTLRRLSGKYFGVVKSRTGQIDPVGVLVADDSSALAVRIASLVSSLPAVEIVGPAADGEAALRMFRVRHPQVVILDLQMPKHTGFEVLRAIRAVDARCLVIIVSNLDEPVIRERCLEAGANHFLSKAGNLDQLTRLVSEFRAKGSK